MTNSRWVDSFCRIYSALLYAYPRDFRVEFGGEMQQVFRDRCRDVARRGTWDVLRFAAASTADWLTSTVREAAATLGSATLAARTPVKRGFVSDWAFTALLYLFVSTTLVQAYVVPTGSMDTTLRVGDHMLVDRLAYANTGWARHLLPSRDPERGDIVCFHYPEDVRQTYVKRVIGLPGDRIRLENKQVIRNGRPLVEPYARYITAFRDPYRDDFPKPPDYSTTPRGLDMLENHVVNGELVVPPDTLFVMGDNRDNSLDSRYWGLVPREWVVGKPLLVYWSYDAPTDQLKDWTFDHVVDVATHFFTKTRWERTFLVPRSETAQ